MDALAFLPYVVEQVTQHLESLDCAQVLFVIHNVLKVEYFDFGRWWQTNSLVEITRQTVLYLVLLFTLLLNFFGEFVLLVNQNTDVLPNTFLQTVVLVYFAHVQMQTHELNNTLLTQQMLGHQVALHN